MAAKEKPAGDVAAASGESSKVDDPAIFVRGASGKDSNPVNPTTGKKPEPPKKPEFERSLARLEEVAKKLENANLSLDEAMKLFEEGVQLSRDCQKQLEEAEGRVEILLKMADGKMAAQPFEPEAEEES